MERDIGTHAAGVAVTDFNSHAHVERDDSFADGINVPCNFNSHAHVERDGVFFHTHQLNTNFNSHAHVERDAIS